MSEGEHGFEFRSFCGAALARHKDEVLALVKERMKGDPYEICDSVSGEMGMVLIPLGYDATGCDERGHAKWSFDEDELAEMLTKLIDEDFKIKFVDEDEDSEDEDEDRIDYEEAQMLLKDILGTVDIEVL